MDDALVSQWYSGGELCELASILEVGDRLEFDCSLSFPWYHHWALCYDVLKGNNAIIIHLEPPKTSSAAAIFLSSSSGGCGGVAIEALASVLQLPHGKVRRNNADDNEHLPQSPDGIRACVKRALCKGDKVFNLATYNCEHFVNDCRYGVAFSRQVEGTVATADDVAVLADRALPWYYPTLRAMFWYVRLVTGGARHYFGRR